MALTINVEAPVDGRMHKATIVAENGDGRLFTDKADLTPYTHEPARIDLAAKNTKNSYGAQRSSRMDFSEYDLVDDFELNEILWRSIKGVDAPIPPTVRRAIANRQVSRR